MSIVDVADGKLHRDRDVVIVGNRIQAVGATKKVRIPTDAQVVDARGKYLIPGLWDMHVHARRDQDYFLPLLTAFGVTGIRDVNQRLDSVRQWREEIAAGQRVGPRILATGFDLISGPDRARFLVAWISETVMSPEEAKSKVAELKAMGADFVKVHGPFMPRDIYFAIAAEARRLGLPLVGHLPIAVTLLEASDSGHRSIEHITDFRSPCAGRMARVTMGPWPSDSVDEAQCASLVAQLARNDTWFTPTLAAFENLVTPSELWHYWPRPWSQADAKVIQESQKRLQHGMALVRVAHRAGMPMLAGTDLQKEEVASIHRELELLVTAGLTPLEALRTATLNPAKYLHATDSLGIVAPGKVADLVLLDANPLVDIGSTRKIRAVVANGRYFDRAALDGVLVHQEALATAERTAYLKRFPPAQNQQTAKEEQQPKTP